MRKLISIFSGNYSMTQKMNYLKYYFSPKSPYLAYKPITLSIVSTDKCTLNCAMCPTHSPCVPDDYVWRQNAAKDMSLGLLKEIVKTYPEAIELHIIGAGEPMLNSDFFDMVEYASTKGRMKVKTFSNGTTIRNNMDRILSSSLDSLTVSINGHTQDEFNRMTGIRGDIFDEIVQSTKELVDKKREMNRRLAVKLSFIIDKTNYRQLKEMIAFSDKVNPDHVFLCNFLPCPYDGLTPKERVIMTDSDHIINYMREVKRELPAEKRAKISFPIVIDHESAENRCSVHFQQMRVDGSGNVSSCSMMLLNMKNAATINIDNCWNSDFFIQARKMILEKKEIDELCLYCPSNKGVEL